MTFQASGRWSGFRQGMSQAARDIVLSNECSYSVHGPAAEAAAVALTLLEKDSFHFGRTSTVSLWIGNLQTQRPNFASFAFNRVELTPAPHINTGKCFVH